MPTKVKLILIIVPVVVVAAAFLLTFTLFSSGAMSQPSTDTGSNAKLNINVVCEGALAYMTFPSSVEADAFVQDCKDGKHPEVIEKYKADMNLGDGAAI